MIATNPNTGIPTDPVSQWLFWFIRFLPVLADNAPMLNVTDDEIEALLMAREDFMGSMCPAHQFHKHYSEKEKFMLFQKFQVAAHAMVLRIDQMGILEYHHSKTLINKEPQI